MPTLKLYVFHYDGPEPAKMLEQAMATIFPGGVPQNANVTTVVDQEDPVDEPTDLEPLDEPTTVEPPSTPCATPELPAQELPAHVAKPLGVIAAARQQAIEYLRQRGPTSRAEVGRAVGLAKGSIPFAFRHPAFVVTDAGLLWLADAPEPAPPAKRVTLPPVERQAPPASNSPSASPPPLARPVIVPPRRGPGRPPKAQPEPGGGTSIDELTADRGAVALCRDAIAAELVVMEPQAAEMLARRTKFSGVIVAEALRCDRFRKTSGGYALK